MSGTEFFPQTWIDWYPKDLRQTYSRLHLRVDTAGYLHWPDGTSDAEVEEFVANLREHWEVAKKLHDQQQLAADPIGFLFG